MERLAKILKFDVKLERFAEVFGDMIDMEDAKDFNKEFNGLDDSIQLLTCFLDDPQEIFNAVDDATMERLEACRLSVSYEVEDLEPARVFFRFINDAYLWDDCEDLGRWVEELNDCLESLGMEKQEALLLYPDKHGRRAVFLLFNAVLLAFYNEAFHVSIMEAVSEDIRGAL